MNNRHLFLVGYRGSGKTTVGRMLAERLNRPFVDLDDRIEVEAGCSIREIFQKEGEPGFRQRESAVLRGFQNPTLESHIVATGGGIVLDPENRELLKKLGCVVWLRADPQTCHRRIQGDGTSSDRRPKLTVGGIQEVEDLIRLRTPMYEEVANLTIDTSTTPPEEIIATIGDQYL